MCVVASSFCTPIQPRTKFQPPSLKRWIEGKLHMFRVRVVFVDQVSPFIFVSVFLPSLLGTPTPRKDFVDQNIS